MALSCDSWSVTSVPRREAGDRCAGGRVRFVQLGPHGDPGHADRTKLVQRPAFQRKTSVHRRADLGDDGAEVVRPGSGRNTQSAPAAQYDSALLIASARIWFSARGEVGKKESIRALMTSGTPTRGRMRASARCRWRGHRRRSGRRWRDHCPRCCSRRLRSRSAVRPVPPAPSRSLPRRRR